MKLPPPLAGDRNVDGIDRNGEAQLRLGLTRWWSIETPYAASERNNGTCRSDEAITLREQWLVLLTPNDVWDPPNPLAPVPRSGDPSSVVSFSEISEKMWN